MKILLIRFSSIGDIIITSPVIRSVRSKFPEAEIHFLTKEQFSGILTPNLNIDKVIVLHKDFTKTLEFLKHQEYDFVIDLHKNIRTLRIKRALKCNWYSYNKLNFKKWLFVNYKINLLPKIHLVDRYFEGLKELGITNDGKGLDFYFPEDFKFNLSEVNLKENEFIALSIGGTYATKRMPKERLLELIKRLDLPVVLLGHGDDDEETAAFLTNSAADKVHNMVGKLSLQQSAYVIKNARRVVTGDTGMMHIAAAFNKKIEAVWGNTHPDFGMFAYNGSVQHNFVTNHQVALNCRPCSKLGSNKCPRGHFNCMNLQDWTAIVNNCNSVEPTQ